MRRCSVLDVAILLQVNWESEAKAAQGFMAEILTQGYRIDLADLPGETVIFGRTAGMQLVRSKIDCALANKLPVLIQGESGTGKEILAKFIHARSNLPHAPFVKLNCAAMPTSGLEMALFGPQGQSSVNGDLAAQAQVEFAEGGTLFLDDIGAMDPKLRSKLQHILQDLHENRARQWDMPLARARIVCATNIDPETASKRDADGEYLFDRVEVICLRLLSLRERKQDIPELFEYLLQKLARKFGRAPGQISSTTLQVLMQWSWPGNLHELENWIARFLILGSEELPGAASRHKTALADTGCHNPQNVPMGGDTSVTGYPITKELILDALQENGWSRRRTAQQLNMSYSSLLQRLGDRGLPHRRRSHRGVPPVQ